MTYEEEIKASHPVIADTELAYLADAMAMKLVGERQAKRDLVNLVRWLIMNKAETIHDSFTATLPEQFDWTTSPVICELNGYAWTLGPENPKELTWVEAKKWCKEQGGELPPREVLLLSYMNAEIRPLFSDNVYWSGTEFSAAFAWQNHFVNGNQHPNSKNTTYLVRAVRKVLIDKR